MFTNIHIPKYYVHCTLYIVQCTSALKLHIYFDMPKLCMPNFFQLQF